MSAILANATSTQTQLLASNPYSQGLAESAAKPQGSLSLGTNQPVSHRIVAVPHKNIEEELFGVAAHAKVLTSAVSMHLNPHWRKRIFQQLDYLLSPANWDALSIMPSLAAYQNFLKTIISYRGLLPPYLGVTRSGNIRAAWREQGFELSCEFFPSDRVRFLLKQVVQGQAESLAWDGPVARLRTMLEQRNLIPSTPDA